MTILSRTPERSYLPKGEESGSSLTSSRRRLSLLQGVADVWAAALNAIAPLGYEDESGFHYGFPPVHRN